MKKSVLTVLCVGWAVGFCSPEPAAGRDLMDQIKNPVEQTIRIRQETQQAEDQWALEKETLSAKYDELVKRYEKQQAFRDELEKDIRAYAAGNDLLARQIEDAEAISREIRPYLEAVYKRLKETISVGSPFLMEERTRRLGNLRAVLDDPGVEVDEKFRKMMEAVFIEAEYGNTIEVYPQKISAHGKDLQVRIFRLGRISLFFKSPDGKQVGYFDVNERQWKFLPEKYSRNIGTAIDIGAKKRPVDLVELPLGRISTP